MASKILIQCVRSTINLDGPSRELSICCIVVVVVLLVDLFEARHFMFDLL